MERSSFLSLATALPFSVLACGGYPPSVLTGDHWDDEPPMMALGVTMDERCRPIAKREYESAGYIVKWEHWRTWDDTSWHDMATDRFRIPTMRRHTRYSVRLAGPVPEDLRAKTNLAYPYSSDPIHWKPVGSWPWTPDTKQSWSTVLELHEDGTEGEPHTFIFATFAAAVSYPLWYSAKRAAQIEKMIEYAVSRQPLRLIGAAYHKPEGDRPTYIVEE